MYAEEISSSLAATAIFLFALLLSMVKGSVDGSLHVIDGLVLLNLCFSFLFSVLSLFGYRTLLYQPSQKNKRGIINGLGGFGTYFRLFLAGAVAAYAVWFWTLGIYHLEQSYPGDAGRNGSCATVVWVFGTFKVESGVKWLMRIGSVIAAIYFGGLAMVALTTLIMWLGATLWEFFTGRWGKVRSSRTLVSGFRQEWRARKTLSGLKGRERRAPRSNEQM